MRQTFLLYCLACFFLGYAQDPYEQFEGMVNPLNGKFSFGTPVIQITASNGQSKSIGLSYYGDVRTNQLASNVGLGWSLNTGEITRQVMGFPDEKKAYSQLDEKLLQNGIAKTETTVGTGPMAFTFFNSGANNTMDILLSPTATGPQALSPAFDRFSASGLGANGSFQLSAVITDHIDKPADPAIEPNIAVFAKNFKTALMIRPFTANSTTINPQTITNINEHNFIEFAFDNDPLRNNFIQSFTHNDIVNGVVAADFMDYYDEDGVKLVRSYSDANDEDIAAFIVYGADGLRYHYSLPVYHIKSESYYYRVDENQNIDFTDSVQKITKDRYYAVSWKLTCITGPDYVDANANGYADDGDEGYWLKFNYSQWKNRIMRSPRFGFTYGDAPQYNEVNYGHNDQKHYTASVSLSHQNQYYLESIETDIEKLVFYKDFRDDEFSFTQYDNPTSLIPSLRIAKIVRFSKYGALNTSSNGSVVNLNAHFTPPNASGGSYNKNKTYLLGDYTGTEGKVLGAVEFIHDYSLQKDFYGNVNKFGTAQGYYQNNNSSLAEDIMMPPTAYSSGGKLTLQSFNLKGEDDFLLDSYSFEYTSNNPDFDPNDFDNNGYHIDLNGDIGLRNRNLNINPAKSSDVWLLNKITYPTDVVVEIDYEEDVYRYALPGVSDSRTEYISLKNPTVLNRFGADVDDHEGRIEIEAEIENPNDLKMLFNTSGMTRDVELSGQVIIFKARKDCAGSNTYDDLNTTDFEWGIFGSLPEINSTGLLGASNATLQIKSIDQVNSTIVFEANWALSDETDRCPYDDVEITPRFEHLYIGFKNKELAAGSSRVKELRVKESATASAARYEYLYSKARASSYSPETFIRYKTGIPVVFQGSMNTPFNSIPSSVLYGKTRMLKYGANGIFHSSSIFEHDVHSHKSIRSSFVPIKAAECFVPNTLLKMSPKALWDLVYEDKRDPNDFGIVWAALMQYIDNSIIPNNSHITSIADSGSISRALPAGMAIQNAHGLMLSTTHQNCFLLNTSSYTCNGTMVHTVDQTATGPYPIPYFLFADNSSAVTNAVTVRDRSAFLGQLLQLTVRDVDSNVLIQNEYEYDVKAVYYANYKAYSFGSDGNNDREYYYDTEYSKFFPYPKRKIMTQEGIVKVEQIYDLNRRNGEIASMAYHSKDENVLKNYTYLCDDLSMKDYWPKSYRAISDKQKRIVNEEGYHTAVSGIFLKSFPLTKQTSEKRYYPNRADLFDELHYYTEIPESETPSYSSITENVFGEVIKQRALDANGDFVETTYDPVQEVYAPLGLRTEVRDISSRVQANEGTSLVDEKDRMLESVDYLTGLAGSAKYLDTYDVVYTSSKSLHYDQYTATGFEDPDVNSGYCEGEVKGAGMVTVAAPTDPNQGHTGRAYLHVPLQANAHELYTDNSCINFDQGGRFVFSIWVRNSNLSGVAELNVKLAGENSIGQVGTTPSVQINSTAYSNAGDNLQCGDWTLLKVEINVPEGFHVPSSPYQGIGGTTYYGGLQVNLANSSGSFDADDFRFHPAAAPIEVSVFDLHSRRVSAALNQANMGSKIIYDAKGREKEIYTETLQGFILTSKTTYND
jgi:hypothetical protein